MDHLQNGIWNCHSPAILPTWAKNTRIHAVLTKTKLQATEKVVHDNYIKQITGKYIAMVSFHKPEANSLLQCS
jgi:hypothetical protein